MIIYVRNYFFMNSNDGRLSLIVPYIQYDGRLVVIVFHYYRRRNILDLAPLLKQSIPKSLIYQRPLPRVIPADYSRGHPPPPPPPPHNPPPFATALHVGNNLFSFVVIAADMSSITVPS